MSTQVMIALSMGMVAMVDDLNRRRIANWIPMAAMAGGFGWQIGRAGMQGALIGLGGAVLGFAVFLIFYLLGGMGAGDVKLMSGFGALLGAAHVMQAALWTAGIGGLIAIGAIAWNLLKQVLKNQSGQALTPEEKEREASIPYAPAITLGVWLSLASGN